MCTYNADQASLESYILARPGKIPVVETKRAVFSVSTAGTDGMDALSAELCASGLTAELKFSLFAVVWTLSTGGGALVARGARDTYTYTVSMPRVHNIIQDNCERLAPDIEEFPCDRVGRRQWGLLERAY